MGRLLVTAQFATAKCGNDAANVTTQLYFDNDLISVRVGFIHDRIRAMNIDVPQPDKMPLL
jgi:hypothetical protein